MLLRLAGALAIGLMMTLGAGCSGGESKEQAAATKASASKILRINLGAEPKTLDPTFVTVIPDNKALHALMEGLVVLDEKAEPTPGVAESWEPSADYKTWTFKLRKDARWHNGDPVVAGDFVYSAQRILTKKLAAGYASMVYQFVEGGRAYYEAGGLDSTAPLTGVEAIDDHTLVYRLVEPAPYFPTVVFFACWLPINRKAVEAGGENWAANPDTYVGNGAFRMSDYRSGDRITTVKADTYWDKDAIFWESIELFMMTDASTENAAFMGGELDITQTVALGEVDRWLGKPEFNAPQGLASYYVLFNTTAAPFDDARVRRAFSLVIDRDLITSRVVRRGERSSTGLIPASMPSASGGLWRDKNPALIGKPDVAEAKRLLKEAGYGEGGKPLPPIEYSYNTSEEHKVIGEQLQGMWRDALGADVRLQNMENGVLSSRFARGDYQMARSSWVADYIDPINFLEIYQSTNSYNRARVKNPKLDELLTKARVETDPVKREAILAEAERIVVVEESAIAPIYDFAFTLLIQTSIENVGVNKMAWINYVRGRRK